MAHGRRSLGAAAALLLTAAAAWAGPLDPKGTIHVPIGVADTRDALKTFVEAEGGFSPGFGSYGVSFWLYDAAAGRLTAPTMPGVACGHGLPPDGALIPWSAWDAGGVHVQTEVCEVRRPSSAGAVYVVGARAALTNTAKEDRKISLFVALRPLGPAGWPVKSLAVRPAHHALLADGHPALIADEAPSAAGVMEKDGVGELAIKGEVPDGDQAWDDDKGNCSGALRFDRTLKPGETATYGFVCPVLPGRRAVAHRWDGKGHAQGDLAEPNPTEGGLLQPDPGVADYHGLKADALFEEAAAYWKDLTGRATLTLPDRRWGEAFAAITGHLALCLDEGAPDVAVINYNVFNRDGVYVADVLEKAGRPDLAARAVDYFLSHPFNGRPYPEADNPGQVLWILGEHWRFTRDKDWLKRVYPSARKLAAMISYYRTTKGPHWVSPTSLDFGDALPADRRQELKPGSCDGSHPEYTEAFDLAGLRAAAELARAADAADDAAAWAKLAETLAASYDERFGPRLGAGYGSYSVLWPCRLYPLREGKAYEQFRNVGPRGPVSWRYFPLATAHQGLLAGNRQAACGTLAKHLDFETMRGWYLLDEGGDSGEGAWKYVRTTWRPTTAMPHGWAVAEFVLLLRDSLMYEDGGRLVLLGGAPEEWFTAKEGMKLKDAPTYFGPLSLTYRRADGGATLTLAGAEPPDGFVLRLPTGLKAKAFVDDKALSSADGDAAIPAGTKEVRIEFGTK